MADDPDAPYKVLRCYGITEKHPDYDDILSEVNMAYWRVCVDYQESCRLSLKCYADSFIYTAARKAIAKRKRYGFCQMRYSPAPPHQVEIDIENELEATKQRCSFREFESRMVVESAMRFLDAQYRTVIEYRFFPPYMTLQETAKKIGIARERARQLQEKALSRLKEVIERQEAKN